MRKLLAVMSMIALAATLAMAQDAAKKPAGEKKAATHSDMAKPEAMKQSPYVGTWKLNTGKSKYPDASMKPKSATLHITKWDEKTIAWNYTATDASGKVMTASYSAPNDGKTHPVKGNDPQFAAAEFKASGNDVDITWKDAKGNTAGTEHATLAADGKSFTDDQTMNDKSGKEMKFTEVYDKSSGGMTHAAKKTAEKPAEKK